MKNLTQKIENNKELKKAIDKVNHYGVEGFERDAKRYIKAIKEGRMINSIGSVSSSGMSRTIKFVEINGKRGQFRMYNFFAFFKALGYSPADSRSDYFRIGGCGMDMIFATNYNIIHQLQRLGFMNKKTCSNLAQQTPSTI